MKPIVLTPEAKANALEIFKQLLEKQDANSDLRISITADTLIQQQGIEKPTVFVTSTAYVKMMSLINSSNQELAWHGVATRVNNNYLIEDVIAYPQLVTSTTVDADEEEYAKWLMGLSDNVINNLRFQGHSHVNMPASPSGRDTDNWLKFANLLKDDEFYILCIGNKSNSFYWNIYDKAINVHFENNDITMVVIDEKGNNISEWAKESIDKYIKTSTPVVTSRVGFNTSRVVSVSDSTNNTAKQTSGVKTYKSNELYKAMMAYVPKEHKDSIDYEVESDVYFAYVTNIPDFYYSALYGCYICQGARFRSMHPIPDKKKDNKTSKKGGKK